MTRFTRWSVVLCTTLALASPAFADRTQVYSLQRLHCVECGDDIGKSIKKIKGVKKYSFDYLKAEATVTMLDNVTDEQVVKAVQKAGYEGGPGAGNGKYMDFDPYPEAVDFAVLVKDGSTVGPLDSLRVVGKFTVFDVYADWCMPCRTMDMALHAAVGERTDIAIRRLNVVSWESALAKQLAGQMKALPHLVIYSPDGKATVVEGAQPKKLQAALAVKTSKN